MKKSTPKRMGRPRKSATLRRDQLVKFMATKTERDLLQRAAAKEQRTLSDYVRLAAVMNAEDVLGSDKV